MLLIIPTPTSALPESKDRNGVYDSITVIIDLLTGMVHLVPSRTNYKAHQVAELLYYEVLLRAVNPEVSGTRRDTRRPRC